MTIDSGSGLSEEQVTDIVKKKRKRPDRTEALTPTYEPGVMSKMITDAMNLSNMGPVDMYDPEQVERRVMQCLQYMIEHDMKPTVESMALAFNTNRTQLWKWKEGVESHLPERSRNAIKKGYAIMNQLLTQTMADGKINPVAAIFLLKNNHQYKDQTDVVVTPNNPYQAASDEELKDKYLTDIPGEE
jgi:hypothetical protein